MVEFVMDPDYDTAEQLALQNSNTNRMAYYVGPQYRENRRLYNAFYWYCQAERYMSTPSQTRIMPIPARNLLSVPRNFTKDLLKRV